VTRYFKVALLFFVSVATPASIYYFVSLILFEFNCDPKFGCVGTFQLVSSIFVIPAALIATVSALIGFMLFRVYSFQLKVGTAVYGLFSLLVIVLVTKTIDSDAIAFIISLSYFLIGPIFLCKVVANDDGR
jgi:hypothetical protein